VDARAIGFVGEPGDLDVGVDAEESIAPELGTPMRLAITTRGETPGDVAPAHAALDFLLADSPADAWRAIYQLEGEKALRVAGRVTGASGVARVYGLDAEGMPRVRVRTDAQGGFDLVAPATVTEWYAALDAARTSTPIAFTPGTSWDLR